MATDRWSEMTLDEVAALDAGSWFGPAFRGTGVPTLERAAGPGAMPTA